MADSFRPPKEPESSNLPALVQDYRAQRDEWRAQTRNLVRMREELLAAADRESGEIVAAARADVGRILLKARRDLLVLAAQVQATTDMDGAGDGDQGVLGPNDLVGTHDGLTSVRNHVSSVLHESRPDLEALSSQDGALRANLLGRQTPTISDVPSPIEETEWSAAAELPAVSRAAETALPSLGGARAVPGLRQPRGWPRLVRAFVAAAVIIGLAVVVGTRWRQRSTLVKDTAVPQTVAAISSAVETRPRMRPTQNPAALSIKVEARRPVWIRLSVDGRIATARLFKANETQQITTAREVSIRAGDAGAVFVSLNGGQTSALGRDGHVLTRRFAVEAPSRTASAALPSGVPSAQRSHDDTPAALTASVAQKLETLTPLPDSSNPSAGQAASREVTARTPAAIETTLPGVAPEAASANPGTGTASLREELVAAAERWLDAYYRQDRARMTALSSLQVTVSDERADTDRLPGGLSGVRRTLDDANLQVFGSAAVLTARVTERAEDLAAGRTAQSVSFISQMWTHGAGGWQLNDVRVASKGAVDKGFRR